MPRVIKQVGTYLIMNGILEESITFLKVILHIIHHLQHFIYTALFFIYTKKAVLTTLKNINFIAKRKSCVD